MRYKILKWTIQELIELYDGKKLNLNPSYQRNDIWTEKAQMDLISSISLGMPIPNFFLHERQNVVYDIADGQQRTRAILAYRKGDITDNEGRKYKNDKQFLNYLISVIVLNKDVTEEEVRKFYVKVNNTGLRLNSPELTKSEHFNSKVLKLVEELSDLKEIETLGLFNLKQEERMLDREFMEELVAQILYGITDKKLGIKKLYSENIDITNAEINEIKKEFKKVIKVFSDINSVIRLKDTRYSQKNDFYTLFGLIKENDLKQNTYLEIFKFLVKIQDDISPSNDKCPLLQEYAFNCITQSHGKTARERRYQILKSLSFNESNNLSKEQKNLSKYYKLTAKDTRKEEGIILLDSKKIKSKFLEL